MNDALRDELSLLRDLGYTHLDVPERGSVNIPSRAPSARPLPLAGEGSSEGAGEGMSPFAERPGEGMPLSPAACETLAELAALAAPCTKCKLASWRTQVVFGVGNPNADLMFIGEAPGRDEDIQGEPFVGRAGQLLTDIIKAMKLTRDDVYIANVVKCRPPENRNPEPDELDACRPFIKRQVELIQPKVIVTLGRFGLQSLTEKAYSISSVRGSWLDYNGVKVMPTYHPAYLLRNPAAKKDVWNDMKKVMTVLGIVF